MEPFYVGKGQPSRVYARKNKSAQSRINFIKESGFDQLIEIIECETEEIAFALERDLIQKFGRRDLETGTLWNFTDGGEGHSNYGTPEQRSAKARKANASRTIEQKRENVKKMHAGLKGKKIGPRPPEVCAKISETKKRNFLLKPYSRKQKEAAL
jgi:hypothetical protein